MDQCDGQMDVFEVLKLVEREGLVPVREDEHLIVMYSERTFPLGKMTASNFADIASISLRPLWNRTASPRASSE